MSQTKAELINAKGDAAFDTNTLYIDSTNNRVGVGTTSPGAPVHVSKGSAGETLRLAGDSANARYLSFTSSDVGAFTGAAWDRNINSSAGIHAWSINGTERARIDSSGRLLVGTSSALANVYYSSSATAPSFQIEGSGVATSSFSLTNTAATNGGTLTLQTGSSGNSPIQDATVGIVQFNGFDGTNYRNAARISAAVDGTPGANTMPGRLVFSTTSTTPGASATERMRIDSEGNIKFGGVGYFREVAGTPYIIEFGSFPGTTYSVERQIQFYANTNNGSSAERMRISGAGAIFFPGVGTTASAANAFLNSGSSPANQLLRSTSSLRYKTNIEDLEEERSNLIFNFRPVWYRSTADADRKDWSWYGLIAEEVAEIEPRLVHWTYLDDAYEEVDGEKQLKPDAEMVPDGVQYDRLTVLLLDVVKRQQQSIETLEAKVAALETP